MKIERNIFPAQKSNKRRTLDYNNQARSPFRSSQLGEEHTHSHKLMAMNHAAHKNWGLVSKAWELDVQKKKTLKNIYV